MEPVQQEVVREPVQHGSVRLGPGPSRRQAAAGLQVDQGWPAAATGGDANSYVAPVVPAVACRLDICQHVHVCPDEQRPEEAAAEGEHPGGFPRRSG